jgi:hypothetical protein
MPSTVLDLIKSSMRLIKALNVGDQPTADEEQDGLDALNVMVDGSGTEALMKWSSVRQVFNTVAGQPSYAIGPSGPDWIVPTWPEQIDQAFALVGSGGQVSEQYVRVLTPYEWGRESLKSLSSTQVTKIYYDRAFVNGSGNVFTWPIPQTSGQMALWLAQAIGQFTSVNQTISFPPGYKRYMKFNLALELAAEFGAEPPASVVAIALDSKNTLQVANLRLNPLRSGLCRGGLFNILTGDNR